MGGSMSMVIVPGNGPQVTNSWIQSRGFFQALPDAALPTSIVNIFQVLTYSFFHALGDIDFA